MASVSVPVLPVVFIACTAATPAFGQSTADRPYRGLFGDSRATLTSSLSTFGGYDLLTHQRTLNGNDVRSNREALYGGFEGGLAYHRPIGKISLDASGSTNMYLYRQTATAALRSHTSSGQMSIGIPMLRRGRLRAAQSFSASSYYNHSPFGFFNPLDVEDLPPPTSDARVTEGRTYDYRAFSNFSVATGRYDTISVDGSIRHLFGVADAPRLTTVGGGGRWSRRVARAWTTQFGYGVERGLFDRDRSAGVLHRLDAGASYSAPLSFSRRTRIAASFGAGLAAYQGTTDPPETQYVPQAVGSASLSHQLGRTWSLSGAYTRQFQLSELTINPTLTNSAMMSLRGLAARRIGLSLSGGYSRSALDAGRSRSSYDSVITSARSQFAFSRNLALSVEYSYYVFDGTDTLTGAGRVIGTEIGRQTVRIGFSAWLPLLQPRGQ